MKTSFLDSSVIFSAVNSPSGGSSKLFTLKNIKLTTSNVVLTEVERNIRKKLYLHHLDRFFILVGQLTILKQEPKQNLINKAKKVIVEKDAVILAEAKQAKSDYLVTLDKKHFLQTKVKEFIKPNLVITPKELHDLLRTT